MDILIKSLTAAVVTALILIVAKFSGPKLSGAIGGIPIVFAISYIVVTFSNRNLARDFLIGGIYGAIAAIFFNLFLLWLNIHFIKSHWLNFGLAYLLCFLIALGLVMCVCIGIIYRAIIYFELRNTNYLKIALSHRLIATEPVGRREMVVN